MLTKCQQTGQVGRFDRQLIVQQQHLLHILRVQAKVLTILQGVAGGVAAAEAQPSSKEAVALLTEHWALTAAQVAKLDVERKQAGLHGSSSGQVEVLFG